MTEPRKPSPVIAGIVSFLAVLVGGVIVVRTRDEPRTVATTTATVAPTMTHEAIAPTPLPAQPTAIETQPGASTAPRAPVRRRRPVTPRYKCSPEQIELARLYATYEGYGYLVNRCDLIATWLRQPDGGDIVVWLCLHGFPSPAAERVVEVTATADYGFNPVPTRVGWDAAVIEHREGARAVVRSLAWVPCTD